MPSYQFSCSAELLASAVPKWYGARLEPGQLEFKTPLLLVLFTSERLCHKFHNKVCLVRSLVPSQ